LKTISATICFLTSRLLFFGFFWLFYKSVTANPYAFLSVMFALHATKIADLIFVLRRASERAQLHCTISKLSATTITEFQKKHLLSKLEYARILTVICSFVFLCFNNGLYSSYRSGLIGTMSGRLLNKSNILSPCFL
jgi:hypothetical protein